MNPEGLEMAEKILRLFVQLSSKKKVLEAAKTMGITGPRGRTLTARIIEGVVANAKWRYRGLWYANEENKDLDQSILPPAKQFQLVPLPHGPLIDLELLDAVNAKLEDTKQKSKRSGSNDYIYLLSHILIFEDGSNFSGQCAKNREYRYYHNRKHNLRIRCDEIHTLIEKRIKGYITSHKDFLNLVEQALLRRQSELPKVENLIGRIEKSLAELAAGEANLKNQIVNLAIKKESLLIWLDEQLEKINAERLQKRTELDGFRKVRDEILRKTGLDDLKKAVRTFGERLSTLTGTEKRNLIEKLIKEIKVYKDNKLELVLYGEPEKNRGLKKQKPSVDGNLFLNRSCGVPSSSSSVTLENQSTDKEQNGGVDGTRTRGLPRDRRTL